jgi:hypothetical protein
MPDANPNADPNANPNAKPALNPQSSTKPDIKPDAKPDVKPDPNKSDVSADFLRAAADVMVALDSRYLESDLDTQIEMRDELDRAMRNYAQARLAILKRDVICTPADVAQMRVLRDRLANATRLRQLLDTALSFAGFLATRFL